MMNNTLSTILRIEYFLRADRLYQDCSILFDWLKNMADRGLDSKTCVKQPLSRRPKIVFQDQLPLNACQ